MTTRSEKLKSGCHDQNASRVPSRENAGLVSRASPVVRPAAACRPGRRHDVAMDADREQPGRAGPNGGGTRGRELTTTREATAVASRMAASATTRTAIGGCGRTGSQRSSESQPGRRRVVAVASAIARRARREPSPSASAANQWRGGGRCRGCGHDPVLPQAERHAHPPRGRRASPWSRDGAGTSPCPPARPASAISSSVRSR